MKLVLLQIWNKKKFGSKILWSQLLKKKDWIISFLPTLIFKKLAIVVHHWELQYFVPKLIDFPIALRDQPGIYLTSYKLFSTVNQKKVPNKTQILWEDPSNSCFSFPFPNLKREWRGGRYLVLIFLMFEINFTVPTFNYNQVIYYMNSKIFCIVHIVIFWRFCYSTLYCEFHKWFLQVFSISAGNIYTISKLQSSFCCNAMYPISNVNFTNGKTIVL